MDDPREDKRKRGLFKPNEHGTLENYFSKRRNLMIRMFYDCFIRTLLEDPKNKRIPSLSIISQWEAKIEDDEDEKVEFNIKKLGLATILSLLFAMIQNRVWFRIEDAVLRQMKKYKNTDRVVFSTYSIDLLMLNTFKDFLIKTYDDMYKLSDEYNLVYSDVMEKYIKSPGFLESKRMILNIIENFDSYDIPNPYTMRGSMARGGCFTKIIRVSPKWRYRDVKEMFQPGNSVLGINVTSTHKYISKTFGISDLLKPLSIEGYRKLTTKIGTYNDFVPGVVVTTNKGNSFRLMRLAGKGSNGVVYYASTLERIASMPYIPDTVTLKLGYKKNFSEQMVYECVEYLKDTLDINEKNPALVSYYDYAYINGIHILVLEKIEGKPVTYKNLTARGKEIIEDALEFAESSIGIGLQDFEGLGNIMFGKRTDKRFRDRGIYLIDLDPFGQT